MTVLRPGLETVTFENGLPVANSGTTIAGEDEIRTKTDFQDEWYWSVSVRIDGIPLFSKGE